MHVVLPTVKSITPRYYYRLPIVPMFSISQVLSHSADVRQPCAIPIAVEPCYMRCSNVAARFSESCLVVLGLIAY